MKDLGHFRFVLKFQPLLDIWLSLSALLLPVVATAWQAAGDASASEGGCAGVVTHVVALGRADATALHVGAAHAEAQARQAAHAGAVSQAAVV